MTPLLFAAVVALSPAAAPSTQPLDPAFSKPPVIGVLRDGAAARLCALGTVAIIGPDGAPLKKLNELPPGLVEHAVLRVVNGCPVREVVFAGQTYYIGAADPHGVERLAGARIVRH